MLMYININVQSGGAFDAPRHPDNATQRRVNYLDGVRFRRRWIATVVHIAIDQPATAESDCSNLRIFILSLVFII
jgi:hypothetical protein